MTTTIESPTEALVHELLVAQRAIERAEARADEIKAELIARLGEGGKVETPEAKVAIVVATTKVIDVDALEAVASKGLFYKLTKRVVDTAAFKAIEALGQLPPEVAGIVVERQSKPSVRVTARK
jgi:hypothetical protein